MGLVAREGLYSFTFFTVCVSETMQLLSLTVNSHLQQVCVGRSAAADVVCYNSSGRRMSSLSTVGVGVFAVMYNFLSGDARFLMFGVGHIPRYGEFWDVVSSSSSSSSCSSSSSGIFIWRY